MPRQAIARSTKRFDAAESAAYVPFLSPRQLEAARLIAEGLPHGAIAERMGIKSSTLVAHFEEIRRRLDVEIDVQVALLVFAAEGTPRDRNAAKLLATLTPRQVDIVRLIAEGMRQEEMVELLGIRRRLLATELDRIKAKLQPRSWVDVARIVLAARSQ